MISDFLLYFILNHEIHMTTFQIKSKALKLSKYHNTTRADNQIQTSYPPGKNSRQLTNAYHPSTGTASRTKYLSSVISTRTGRHGVGSIYWLPGELFELKGVEDGELVQALWGIACS
jgi:hypothetical protein